jgi:UPF0755 protein
MQKIRLKNLPRFVRKYKTAIRAFFVIIIVVFFTLIIMSIAPSDFPRNIIVRINKDMTVSGAASLLKEKGIIKSAYLYKIYVILMHDGKGIQAGSYLFDEPQSVLRIAYRTSYGIKNVEKIRLTVFEGTNSKEITALLKKSVPNFNTNDFLARAKINEGYLFPETYFVDSDVQSKEIIDMMRMQFDAAIEPLKPALATSTRSLKDIMIMASIIEKEANDMTDRRIISGILWKRLDKGMALQVDVPFYYALGKRSSELTLADLATTSPYNTYTHKGLPPTPITNPGLDAIKAAMYPTVSPYYFYLADRKGITHYANTHDGHVANKEKYLW